MRVIVTGSRGRLGAALVRHFQSQGLDCLALDRQALPLDAEEGIRQRLKGEAFDVLVNPAGATSVDGCEKDPDLADRVNARGPGVLADICREKGARMLHVSTDYVFDGISPGLRGESDPVAPISVYGRSKAAGERAVLEASPRNLVLRTSWVFGPDRPAFPEMILQRAREDKPLRAVADKWSCPCYSVDFASWCSILLGKEEAGGVLHLCNQGPCTWQEYASEVVAIAHQGGLLPRLPEVQPMAMDGMEHFVACRPVHTAMDTASFTALTGIKPRPWRDAMREHLLGGRV